MRIAESSARELHLDSNARSSGMDSTRARTTTCHLMGDVEMLTFPDGRALAQAAAKQWLQQVQARAPQPSPYCLALSGGRIAGRFFEPWLNWRENSTRLSWRPSFFGVMSVAFLRAIRKAISAWLGPYFLSL